MDDDEKKRLKNLMTIFIVEYYELLTQCDFNINTVYSKNANLTLIENSIKKVKRSNYSDLLNRSNRRIIKYDGYIIGNSLIVHVLNEVIDSKIIFDEFFQVDILSKSMLILNHSIHPCPCLDITEIKHMHAPPAQQKDNSSQKEKAPTPSSVTEYETLNKGLTVLIYPVVGRDDEGFLNFVSNYGSVTRYCKGTRKFLIEFKNRKQRDNILNQEGLKWNNKDIRVTPYPKSLRWD